MVALHLIPIHRALAVRFHSIGPDGQYSLAPMFMDDSRWFPAGETAMIPRREAESAADGSALTIGEVVITFKGDNLVIENKGLPFGKCNAAGYFGALEKARSVAAKSERSNKSVGADESVSGALAEGA